MTRDLDREVEEMSNSTMAEILRGHAYDVSCSGDFYSLRLERILRIAAMKMESSTIYEIEIEQARKESK